MKDIGGYVIQTQHFSVNDGNGIRSTIFLAGCPLHCQWCANPEGLTCQPKIGYLESKCTSCGICAPICPLHLDININQNNARLSCTSCGACADVCPNHAKIKLVEYKSTDKIIEEIKRQIVFFRYSGGGVTFSGGEATMQEAFLRELVTRLEDLGISITLETCAYFDYDKVADILCSLDMLFVDIKVMDDIKHKHFTGVSNQLILENIKKFAELPIPIVVRIPTIIGVNADDENIIATSNFVHENLPNARIELLPYHSLASYKYESLGMRKPSTDFKNPSFEEILRLRLLIESYGVETVEWK